MIGLHYYGMVLEVVGILRYNIFGFGLNGFTVPVTYRYGSLYMGRLCATAPANLAFLQCRLRATSYGFHCHSVKGCHFRVSKWRNRKTKYRHV